MKIFFLLVLIIFKVYCDEIQEKPFIQDLLVSSKLIEGKKTFLTCQVSGGTQPISFEWFFNDNKIQSNNNLVINDLDESSILNIKSLSFNNSGEYTCKAFNIFGQDLKSISLVINFKPKWKNENIEMKKKINSTFEINCDVNSYPESQVKIEKLFSDKTIEKTFSNKVMTFKSNEKKTLFFKCTAENSIAKIEKIISVHFFGKFNFFYVFGKFNFD